MKTEYVTGAVLGAAAMGGAWWFMWRRHVAQMESGAYSAPAAATSDSTPNMLSDRLGDFIDSARDFFSKSEPEDETENAP
jgi:hypothetical protein